METITWNHFQKVELRCGTIVDVQPFPEARKPALKVWVDLGEFGIKKSSAQITHYYSADNLLGRQVICVVNFPPKQIATFISEVLITGFADEQGHIVLAVPDKSIRNGARLI